MNGSISNDEMKLKDLKWWKKALYDEIANLETLESIMYLARKASNLVEKEQHVDGNIDYIGMFSDPDGDLTQDSGG